MLTRVAAVIACLWAIPAASEPIFWATSVDDDYAWFEICVEASPKPACKPIPYARWQEPANLLGDMWLHVAEVDLEPGVRAWIEGVGAVGRDGPSNPYRIWCSPWDFTADGYVGIWDYLRWMVTGFEGGTEAQRNLRGTFARECR